jgi:hypothetical protein
VRFLPLQRLASPEQRHRKGGPFHDPPASVSRFSQPPDASFRPEPAGLVACRIRSWGSPFRALFLSRRRQPSPAPLPSCRWSTRGGLCPQNRKCSTLPRTRSIFGSRCDGQPRRSPASGSCSAARVRPRGSPGPAGSVALLGLLPSRVLFPAGMARPSSKPPLLRLANRAHATGMAPLQGLGSSGAGWPLARLPTLLGFPTS